MTIWPRLQNVFRNLFHRRQSELDLDDELESLVAHIAEENIRRGMNPQDAIRNARLRIGGIEQLKEEVRTVRSGNFLESVAQDIRYGIRLLRRSPFFALAAILTLGIGIGANTAIFTVVHAVLLNPLPYPNSERLAIIWAGLGNERRAPESAYQIAQLREQSQFFDQIGGIWVTNSSVPGDGEPEQVKLGQVTDNFLSLLCARPALGRLFTHDDVQPNAPSSMIISYALWQRRFGGDSSVIGRGLRAGKNTLTIVGVLPQNFRLIFPDDSSVPPNVDLFFPIPINSANPNGSSFLRTIGRLRAGANFSQAQSEANEISARLRKTVPDLAEENFSLQIVPLHDDDVRNVRRALTLLFGGVAFVLLIACANVANLLLARSGSRIRETTVRAALGAPRSRTIRQLLTESILLALAGGVVALAIGWAALRAILAMRPESLLRVAAIHLDAAVFAYTLGISMLTGIIFGVAPALAASRTDLLSAMKTGSRGATPTKHHSGAALIAGEVALSFALLVSTALLVRTFIGVLRVNPGFQPANVLTFTTSPGGYNFVKQLQQNLLTIPGVESASVVSHLPLDDSYSNWYDAYFPEGTAPADQNSTLADNRSILPGFFQTIGATLIEGRDFTDADDAQHQHVAIIDDALAQQTWPGQDPLGKKLNTSDSPKGFYAFERDWLIVVGVVKHVQYHSLTTMVRPQIYVPFQLAPRPVSFVLRSSAAAASLRNPIREQLSKLNKTAPVARLILLSDLVHQARAQNRFVAVLAAMLAGIALLLACIGIAGVTAYSISRRTSEIGIRMTLGATRGGILRMIFGQNFTPVIAGLALGLAISLAVTPLLRSLLFGVTPSDPIAFASISAFLVLVGALACYFPARRAIQIEPTIALRYE